MTEGNPVTRAAGDVIVVVDDDELVRRAITRALRTRGFSTLEAPDGMTALGLVDKLGHSIAMLVTDIALPDLDGRELARTVRMQHPELAVLYISGYPSEEIGLDDAAGLLLQKPFRAEAFVRTVRLLLEREPFSR